jgi:hypothetical protein
MTTETLEIVGYFSFDCQEDGYCTYGCGKRPSVVCRECMEFALWVDGETLPDNAHPIFEGLEAGFLEDTNEGEMNCICDWCEEIF